jgi:hypothetical protein
MQNTVNNLDDRYAKVHPSRRRVWYSCKDCGEVVSDRWQHNAEHTRRNSDPVIVFAKMSEIVTILWGTDNGSS